jgi:hypothetical protein
MTFIVSVREVHVQDVKVSADSEDDAKDKVEEGEGEYLDNTLTYSHSLEPETWGVRRAEDGA